MGAKAGNFQKQQLRMHKIKFDENISYEEADILLKRKEASLSSGIKDSDEETEDSGFLINWDDAS